MGIRFRMRVWKEGCLGLALCAGIDMNPLQAAPDDTIVQASGTDAAMLDAMIEQALQDGSVSAEERKLIMGVARRKMTPADIAEAEARLAPLPDTSSVRSTVTHNTSTNAIVPDGATASAINAHDSCCDEAACGGFFDNLYVFFASDGWMGPIDDDDGNNFGYRFGFNAGVPISECRGIGAQFGLSYGRYNLTGRDAGNEQSKVEEQIFLSAGAFKRADLCAECPDRLVLGLVYDHMITDNTGEEAWEIGRLGQLRWQVGYVLSATDEVGLFGSLRLWEDAVDGPSNNADDIRALDQGSIYWHHKWCWSADTTVYFGIADNPGEWVLGAKGEVPISNCASLFGGVHYVMPSADGSGSRDAFAQEYWNVSVGVAYYPGGNAASKTVAGRRWMPLMPVADNGSFGIDIDPSNL
jgi:Family of unknown function (DUF6666)